MHSNPNLVPAVWLGLLVPLLVLLILWEGVWKTIALWKSARHNQLGWFICLAIFNTVGILPIIYLAFCQRDRNPPGPMAPPMPSGLRPLPMGPG